MAEHPEPDDWDETVDVLCIGDGPGSLAYGIFCAASDLDVLIIESTELDPLAVQWRAAMAEDLADGVPDPRLGLIHAEPVSVATINDRTTLEPFVGERLRQWSAHCLASPFGVMFSHVPELDPMRTADGGSFTAGVAGSYRCAADAPGPDLVHWLRERAEGLYAPADDRVAETVMADGRIAGVILKTDDGPRRVGVACGVAVAVGTAPHQWPQQPELAGHTVDVAVIGRPAGRFATVGLLAR